MNARRDRDGNTLFLYDGHPASEDDDLCRVTGHRKSCINDFVREVDCYFQLAVKPNGQRVLNLCNGVTGFESWNVDDIINDCQKGQGLCACVGTPLRWDELWIPAAEMTKVFRHFRLIS